MVSKEEIKKLADLARIEISGEETESLRGEMDAILDYVKIVQEFHSDEASMKPEEKLDSDTEPVRNIMRTDENPTESGTYSERLIAEFPQSERNYLKVKKIL